MNWFLLAEKSLRSESLTKEEALAILTAPDTEVPSIVAAAAQVRRAGFANRVKVNYLVNVKSGLCPEDCHYCSQSKLSDAPIDKYPLMDPLEIIKHAERGMEVGARRACLVASGRGPSNRELSSFCDAVTKLKEKHPHLEVCACLGLLQDGQAEKLKGAGVYAYNHNVNTSEAHYERICATHTYKDRLETVDRAKSGGLSACSGVLAGMGETDQDLVDLAFTLRERGAESIPVNFLVSVKQTPLEGVNHLTPLRCLKILAMFRLVNPEPEIRISGGREVHLRSLQPMALQIANSIFIGDYLTTKGQTPHADLQMIRDLGYVLEGQPADFLDRVLGAPDASSELKDSCSDDCAPAETLARDVHA